MIQFPLMNLKAQAMALMSQPRTRGFSIVGRLVIAILYGIAIPNAFVDAQDKSAPATSEQKVQIIVEERDEVLCFVASNLRDPSAATMHVWRSDTNIDTNPPMMGRTKVEGSNLVFTPRFPFRSGAMYVVKLQPDSGGKPRQFELKVPGESEEKAQIVGVFPSADRLPENTLKFYLQFSVPMQKGDIYRFVRLRKVDGQDVELPFLEIEQEFWSRDSKRLTLLLDPGRIKRGLKPREEMGPILVAGNSYELVVDGNWLDSNGNKLGSDFVKRFEAGPEDHAQPDPLKWKISPPAAGTRDPLVIQFPGSLDYAMLFRVINIVDPGSNPVDGVVNISNNEQRWSFRSGQNWKPGTYTINVSEDLEDNAGNSIGRPFDVDMFNKTESSETTPLVKLTFDVS